MNSTLLTIRNLSVSYESAAGRRDALDGVCLNIQSGDWIMVRGRNGSGKTTLLNTIMGLMRANAGTITFSDNGAEKYRAFMVSQEPGAALPSGLTLSECLRLARGHSKNVDTAKDEKATRLLRALQLNGHLTHSVDQLSGGQRQMAAILMAALADAPLILLDEPTASLDPQNESVCLSALQMFDLHERAIVYVTHNAEHFRHYGNRRCEMNAGRIVELNSTDVASSSGTDASLL